MEFILGCHCQAGMQYDHFHGGELYCLYMEYTNLYGKQGVIQCEKFSEHM